jgi:Ethanolamine utilization protein EutJ (predicted chaperonin)
VRLGFRWPRRQDASLKADSSPAFLAVVDPGSSTLRVLDICVGDRPPTVWGWAERPGSDYGGPDPTRLQQDLANALGLADEMAKNRAPRWQPSDQMLVGLPASGLRAWAWPVTQLRSQPDRPIEERELEPLLSRALRLTLSRLKGRAEPDWLLMEAAAASLTVDGRGVTDPVGFRGVELGASVFAAVVRADTVALWRSVAEGLGFSGLTLTATPLALAACVAEPQSLILDVGTASTSMTWCRAGKPVAVHSIPMGGAGLTESLLLRWRLTQERAETLKRAYASGQLPPQATAQVHEVLFPAVRAWQDQMEQVLVAVSERVDEPLPRQLYLCGGASALPAMGESARSLARSERLDFPRYPQVTCLHATDVPGVANRTDGG